MKMRDTFLLVIPGRAEGANPESKRLSIMLLTHLGFRAASLRSAPGMTE
jgi:hypothetical protein